MLYCTRCGTKIRLAARFCHKCGQKIKMSRRSKNITPTTRTDIQYFKDKLLKNEKIRSARTALSIRLEKLKDLLSDDTSKLSKLPPTRKRQILTVIENLQAQLDEKTDSHDIDDWTKKLEIRIEGTRCLVCLQELNVATSEEVLACPHCHYPSHKSHISSWIKVKNICPLCRNHITIDQLIPVDITFSS